MNLFEKNLETLREFQPGLARRLAGMPFPDSITLVESKDGYLSPKIGNVTIHSTYKPIEEAVRLVDKFSIKTECQNVIYGLGFGYHVLELLKRTEGDLLVIEPLMTVFRAFLSHIEIAEFLPRVRFVIDEPPAKIVNFYDQLSWNILCHRPSFRLSSSYFDKLDQCSRTRQFLSHNRLKVMVVNPIYGGSLPTAIYCASAFDSLGHEVCSVNCEDFADSFHSIQKITEIKANAQILSNRFMEMMSDVILSKAAEFKPDFILVMAQAPLQPKTIARLKGLDVPIAFWFVEDFRTLTYWKDIAKSYDYFFTIQKNTFFDELDSYGISNYYYLPQACDPKVHLPMDLSNKDEKRFKADLSFMGAAYFNRRNVFPRLLDFDFKVWGVGWHPEDPIASRLQNSNERVSTDECVKIYNSAKINLNLHSSSCHEAINPKGDFVNPRTFEVAACGGFQLIDERSDLFELFDINQEIITFESIDELKKLVRYYLKNDKEREDIAKKARARVLREHTFENRLSEMLTFVFYDKLEGLEKRLASRSNEWEVLIEQASPYSELGRYIEKFKGVEKPSLKTIIKDIEKQEGSLSSNELLLLMVDKVVKETRD